MKSAELVISGLSSLDEEELREALGGGSGDRITFSRPEVPEGSLAEPATITAVVTLGSIGLSALAAWLSKARRRRIARGKFRLVRPDGTVEEKSWELEESSEDAVKSKVLAELTNWIGHGSGA